MIHDNISFIRSILGVNHRIHSFTRFLQVPFRDDQILCLGTQPILYRCGFHVHRNLEDYIYIYYIYYIYIFLLYILYIYIYYIYYIYILYILYILKYVWFFFLLCSADAKNLRAISRKTGPLGIRIRILYIKICIHHIKLVI